MPGSHWSARQVSLLLLVLALRERNVPLVTQRTLQASLTAFGVVRNKNAVESKARRLKRDTHWYSGGRWDMNNIGREFEIQFPVELQR